MLDLIRAPFERLFRRDHNHREEISRPQRHHEFVVIGLGRFGSSLALHLFEQGYDVLAIDVDEHLVQRYSNALPHVVHMDTTNKEGLLELGVGNFDTGVVCVGSDFESTILATVLLRQLGVRRVICKARTRTQRDILIKVGADEVVLPEHEAGVLLARRLTFAGFVDYMEVNKEISVVELIAPPNLVGLSLLKSNIREKHNVVVVAIRRADGVIVLPTAEEKIREGDILVVIGRPSDCDSVLKKR
jgi:trk system potassium uptake protein TrkA